MCYVIPFTLPCCRRTYVSVTKMKDCPTDWPKTKCPKELCFQIGSQADDREEGTCWRCKAAEAGIPQEHRESLRPGIDNADVERFILTPEERRSQMEEDGFCWFCGHRCECEPCEPVRIEGVDEGLLGRNRPPPTEQMRPVNKRLKIEHTSGARSRSAPSSSKSKAKGPPQTRSLSKQISRTSSYSQSPPPNGRDQRAFSPSEAMPSLEKLQPKQEYAGYGDQSHFFGARLSGMHSSTSISAPKQSYPGGNQSHLFDPRLFEQPSSSTPESASQPYENSLDIDPKLTNSHPTPSKPEEYQQQPFKPGGGMGEHDLYGASPRTQHLYQQTYGQPQVIEPQLAVMGQANTSTPTQEYSWYGQPQIPDPRFSNKNDAYANIPQSYGQPQVIDPALFNVNQASPFFSEHAYDQNYQQQSMHYSFHAKPSQQSYGKLNHNINAQEACTNPSPSNMLNDYNNTTHSTNNKRERGDEYEYPDTDVARS